MSEDRLLVYILLAVVSVALIILYLEIGNAVYTLGNAIYP